MTDESDMFNTKQGEKLRYNFNPGRNTLVQGSYISRLAEPESINEVRYIGRILVQDMKNLPVSSDESDAHLLS